MCGRLSRSTYDDAPHDIKVGSNLPSFPDVTADYTITQNRNIDTQKWRGQLIRSAIRDMFLHESLYRPASHTAHRSTKVHKLIRTSPYPHAPHRTLTRCVTKSPREAKTPTKGKTEIRPSEITECPIVSVQRLCRCHTHILYIDDDG